MDLNGFTVIVVDYSAALNRRWSHLRLASRISFSRISTSNCRVVFIVLLILEIESKCAWLVSSTANGMKMKWRQRSLPANRQCRTHSATASESCSTLVQIYFVFENEVSGHRNTQLPNVTENSIVAGWECSSVSGKRRNVYLRIIKMS